MKQGIHRTHLVGDAAVGPDDFFIGRRFIGDPSMPDGGLRKNADPGFVTLKAVPKGRETIAEDLRLVHGWIAFGDECEHAGNLGADARIEKALRIGCEFGLASGDKRHHMERFEFAHN
ncbi:MAG: hypothetical protein WCS31_14545 [Verrucomicrobiae bacterium]